MMQFLMGRIAKQLSPYFGYFLNDPAQIQDIEAAEREIGVEFPKGLRDLYLTHNGEKYEEPGLFFGLAFLPLEVMLDEWNSFIELSEEEALQEIASYSVPKDSIKEQYIHQKWIPIATDSGGNFLGVDLDPDTKGTYGQVINFGRDEEVKYVIAHSITDFLTFIGQILQDGFYTIDEEVIWSYSDVEHMHFFDALKQMDLPVLHPEVTNSQPDSHSSLIKTDDVWEEIINDISGSPKRFAREKVLYLGGKGLSSLAPLAACTDVRELILSANQITDLTPLQSLETLKKLYIGRNPITTIESLTNLENLQFLNIANTAITDLKPLKALKKLKELDIADTQVTDYRFLQQIDRLQTLSVSIFSYDQLVALTDASLLKHLHIHQLAGVTYVDLMLFSKLKNLQSLTIEQCVFHDLTFLTRNKKLQELTFVDCYIQDASAMNKMPIEHVECDGTVIENIEVLAASTTLKSFAGAFNQFWLLKQRIPQTVDFSKIIGGMTDDEKKIWRDSLT